MINVADKLRNAPIDTKLYCDYGECLYQGLTEDDYIQVILTEQNNLPYTFDKYGCIWSTDALALFPSEDNDDWNSFNKLKFKPFDKVVVRNSRNNWHIDFFECYDSDITHNGFPYVCIGSKWQQCLPFNEETAKLIGTNDDYKDVKLSIASESNCL